MEADICEENVSLSAATLTDEKVSDNIDENNVVELNELVGKSDGDNVTNQILSNDKDKSQNSDDGLINEEDEYYEVISADGSVGGDVNDDIDSPDEQYNLTNAGLPPVSSVDRSYNEKCSFVDLPFVPKFEFPLDDPSQSENVSNYGAFRVNRFISDNIPKPDKNFTVPPPNYKPLDIKPSFDSVQGTIFSPPVHNPTFSSKQEIVSAVSEKPCEITSSSRVIAQESKKLPEPLKKDQVVDWVDENGDPLPGAFDYVKPNEERDVSAEDTRVEYVYSVKEKKEVPVQPVDSNEPCVLNSGFLISQNVLHKNVVGNLGVNLRLPPGIARKVLDEDEEKKLYEASKSGAEYKAAVQAVTASSSTASTSDSRIVPEKEIGKRDRPPRFRRNRFADIRKEDDQQQDEPVEVKPQKSAEEVALESQAVTEILKEVQRGAARAKEVGALGWQKCPIPVTNKTFLRNTLVSTLREPYRPPGKRGRFHVGLKSDSGKHHRSRDDDRSSSSRSSRSRSFSRSRSSSYSRSRSGSSYTDDDRSGSRDKRRHFSQRGRGSWNRGQHHYYDEAWAAYAAHYGYPWYGPEALPMYYGPEGWPVDPYAAAMYYGDPQAWMEYEAYYGPPNFGPRGMGRGFRGRGRGDRGRGRGRGGFEGEFRGYNFGAQSPREYSRSRSRSGRSRSWSRNLSRSRSRGDSVEMRNRSHSASQERAQRHSKRRPRSKDRSLQGESGDKAASDAETSEKKKKKKKKKKKHKKLKKSKHRQKDEDSKSGDKNSEEVVNEITEAAKISDVNNEKEKPEEEILENYDLVKKRDLAKLEMRKDHAKYKSGEKGDKEVTKKVKDRTSDSKVRESGSEKGDKAKSKDDSKTVDEQLGSSINDEHTVSEEKKKGARTQKENLAHHGDGENKYKVSSSRASVDMSKSDDPHVRKHKDKRSSSREDASNAKRQVDRKGDKTNNSRVNVVRDQMYVDSDSRTSSQLKQDIGNKQKRGISSEFDMESISGRKYQYDEERGNFMYDKRDGDRDKGKRETCGAKEDRKGESRDRNVGTVNVHGREDNRGRTNQESVPYKQKGRTHGDRSESYDSARINGGTGRNGKEGQKYKQDKDVAGRDRRSESNDRGRKITMIDNYKARKEITQRDGRSEFHHDGKKSRIEGYRDGRETTYGFRRSESYDSEEGCKHKVGRESRGASKISQSHGSQERVNKIDCRYKEGKGNSLLATSNKLDSSNTGQRSKSNVIKYIEKDGSIDTNDRERAVGDIKERNKLIRKQKISHVDHREESYEKTAGVNKDIHRKRQRSTSGDTTDDNLDTVQTKRIISVSGVGNQKQKSKNNVSVREECRKFEDRSGFGGKQSEGRVKSDQNNICGGEKPTVDQNLKEGDLKKHRERTESKFQDRSERNEEVTLSEKLKHKRIVKTAGVSKKRGITVDKTGIGVDNPGSTRDSNEPTNVYATQTHPDVTDKTRPANTDKIEESTDDKPKSDSKGLKRKKKTIKKQVSGKKMKASSVRETEGEKFTTEEDGEASKATEKQLAPEYNLNEESEEKTVEKSFEATVESNK